MLIKKYVCPTTIYLTKYAIITQVYFFSKYVIIFSFTTFYFRHHIIIVNIILLFLTLLIDCIYKFYLQPLLLRVRFTSFILFQLLTTYQLYLLYLDIAFLSLSSCNIARGGKTVVTVRFVPLRIWSANKQIGSDCYVDKKWVWQFVLFQGWQTDQ